MKINCPNCSTLVDQQRAPARNDPGAGEAWVCFKCQVVVCVCCYSQHTEKTHPECYRIGGLKPTVGGKKGKKKKKR